jgi:hypothetical protein
MSKHVTHSKRIEEMDGMLRSHFDERIRMVLEQQSIQKQRLMALEQTVHKYNQQVADKISFKDISSVTDVFRQDFTHRLVFDQVV